jgi:hypothetical protein
MWFWLLCGGGDISVSAAGVEKPIRPVVSGASMSVGGAEITATVKSSSAGPFDRKVYQREYMREYMRRKRKPAG